MPTAYCDFPKVLSGCGARPGAAAAARAHFHRIAASIRFEPVCAVDLEPIAMATYAASGNRHKRLSDLYSHTLVTSAQLREYRYCRGPNYSPDAKWKETVALARENGRVRPRDSVNCFYKAGNAADVYNARSYFQPAARKI